MIATTQISGGYSGDSWLFFELKRKLQNIGIKIDYPLNDGVFVDTADKDNHGMPVWTPYEIYVDYYQAITTSDFHIVYNAAGSPNELINEDVAREIIYAMSVNKPIILLYPPSFETNVSPFAQKLITNHLSQIVICDLTVIDEVDTEQFIGNLTTGANIYNLTNQEKGTVDRAVKLYFRDLLTISANEQVLRLDREY